MQQDGYTRRALLGRALVLSAYGGPLADHHAGTFGSGTSVHDETPFPPATIDEPEGPSITAPLTAAWPNILFIVTDDQRWDVMGVVQRAQGAAARFPWVQTPNMDRLAAEGIRFRNAFVVESLCSPSRAAFLTGQYNHRNGVKDNYTPLPHSAVTYATRLRSAGYQTGYFGKWHMYNQSSRPGFSRYVSYVGQGRYVDCPMLFDGVRQNTTGWVNDVVTTHAISFIRSFKTHPFMAVVGFKSAHDPRMPPSRLTTLYSGNTLAPAVSRNYPPPFPAALDRNDPPYDRNYMRTLKGADENIGRLLTTLDEEGLTQDTVVICTSDNGYFLGEHALSDKRLAYEESIRIPVVVRYPRLVSPRRLSDLMILNIDVAPTILELAGVSIPSGMQGRSLRPLLAAQSTTWRTSFLYEYWQESTYLGPTMVGVRTATAKLVRYPGHDEWTQVFNLRADPYERYNQATNPQYATLKASLDAALSRLKVQFGYVL